MHKLPILLLLITPFVSSPLFGQEPLPPEPDDLEYFEPADSDMRIDLDSKPEPPSAEPFPRLPVEPENMDLIDDRSDDAKSNPEVLVPEGARLTLEPHQRDVQTRSRQKPFRHLAEIPGQYRGDWFHLLRMKFARNEIELTTEQRVSVHEVEKKYRKLSRKLLRDQANPAGLPDEENESHIKLQEELSKLRAEAADEVRDDILLADQVQRLEEINFRMKVMSRGIVATLKDEDLGLEVSQEQVEAIETRATELVREYELLMKSFKYDFQEQILDELTRAQRTRIDSLMGDEFKVMDDEADEELTDSARRKQEALVKLEHWREKLSRQE